ncbi:hypothetical protein OSB04_016496, partial [Centaurea solstitialis]
MANTVTNTNNLSLRSILEKDKLTGPNFLDWERNLMIVLRHERKWYVLEEPLPEAPPANAPAATRNAHKKHTDDLLDVGCLMLATMSPDLQAGLMNTNAYDMIRQLRDMFQTQARTERYDATKAFNECKMIKGASVSDHVMKMKRHMDHLERLGHPVPLQLATDTILNSLSEDYTPFVVNYNMNNMEKSIAELHSMLKTAELNMGAKSKPKDVLMVRDGGVKKKHGKGASAKERVQHRPSRMHPKFVKKSKARARARARKSKPTKQGLKIVASHAMKLVIGGKTAQSVMKQMASTVTSTNNLSLRSILEKDKLTGSNFLDWERNLMIVLRHERKWYVLEEPLGEAPPANAPAAARNAHKKHSDDLLDVACLMLATMSPDLQAGLINTNAYDMIRQLRDMFQTQARTERYDATKAFNECKMVKGTSVSDHVMKMKRHLDHLERLGHPVPLQLATDTILNSLSEDYRPFVVNYNMNNMEKTIAELHSMLKTAELNMGNKNKTKDVLMVKNGGVKKKNGHASTSKGKGPVQAIQSAPKKGKGKGKGKKVKPNKARTENRCFICNEIGHWRQNCPKRHEAGRNHSSAQQLRKVAVSHIQELEVSPGSYDQLLNNSYKCCRLKVAQIFDRVANIGRDPRLRLLLGI